MRVTVKITNVSVEKDWAAIKDVTKIHYIATIHRDNGRSEYAGETVLGEDIEITEGMVNGDE